MSNYFFVKFIPVDQHKVNHWQKLKGFIHYSISLQTSDREGLLSEFAQFIKVTVNEEEHAVHKLLGKHFQVFMHNLHETCKMAWPS